MVSLHDLHLRVLYIRRFAVDDSIVSSDHPLDVQLTSALFLFNDYR